jgi:hypothetical protein
MTAGWPVVYCVSIKCSIANGSTPMVIDAVRFISLDRFIERWECPKCGAQRALENTASERSSE